MTTLNDTSLDNKWTQFYTLTLEHDTLIKIKSTPTPLQKSHRLFYTLLIFFTITLLSRFKTLFFITYPFPVNFIIFGFYIFLFFLIQHSITAIQNFITSHKLSSVNKKIKAIFPDKDSILSSIVNIGFNSLTESEKNTVYNDVYHNKFSNDFWDIVFKLIQNKQKLQIIKGIHDMKTYVESQEQGNHPSPIKFFKNKQ